MTYLLALLLVDRNKWEILLGNTDLKGRIQAKLLSQANSHTLLQKIQRLEWVNF